MAGTAHSLSFKLPADPASLSPARERVRSWLDGVAWPRRDQDVAVFVVNEAMTNAIEHGPHSANDHRHLVRVQIDIVPSDTDGQRLIIAVRDDCGWTPPPAPGTGGLGLLAMAQLGADLWVDGRAEGTTLIFTGHTQPHPGARVDEDPN